MINNRSLLEEFIQNAPGRRKIIPNAKSKMPGEITKELVNMGVNLNKHWLY